MNCEKCNGSDRPEEIPYIVHELEMARCAKREKCLIGATAAVCAALIISNIVWAVVVTSLMGR